MSTGEFHRTFDYGGRVVSASHPVKALKTVKKTLLIDSADRDTTKYYTNGDFVVYLPRVYENVVSMRLVAAEFPPLTTGTFGTGILLNSSTSIVYSATNKQITITLVSAFTGNYMLLQGTTNGTYDGLYPVVSGSSSTSIVVATTISTGQTTAAGTAYPFTLTTGSPSAFTHQYVAGQNAPVTAYYTNDAMAGFQSYFLVDIEGMNKTDETTVAAQKSTFSDSFFAKIPALSLSYGFQSFIEYNDHSAQENIARYSPAIGKIDRLHIRTRLHSQQDRSGFIYWTNSSTVASGNNQNLNANYNLTLEIEYLDNVFDDFSALETHLTSRT